MSATYIAGNASNGFWDTAGESVDLTGMDISTLEGSVLNWEHKSEKPTDYVGKILKAKKIFSAEDCSNELEKKYWDKCQVPFLFCLCVLFSEYQPAAKEVAGIFAFDTANPTLKPTLGFSVEGSKAEIVSGVITKSIARKLTLTAQPANHACVADKVDLNASVKPVDPLSSLFKSQSVEIELLSLEKLEKMEKSMNPSQPKEPKPGLKQAPESEGMSIGTTQSGKHVMSHAKIHNYKDFSAQDHRDASVLHLQAASRANLAKNPKMADIHNQKMKLHHQAAAGLERKANRFGNATKAKENKVEVNKILGKKEDLNKALEARSMMVASGNKTQGAALQKEDIKIPKKDFIKEHKELVNALKHPTKNKIKNEIKDQSAELEEITKAEMLRKTYASEAQRRWAHTEKGKEALGGDAAVHEWDEKSKGKKLPEKVSKSEELKKEDNINKPLVNKVPGKNMSHGWKAGMGMSNMGQKVRHGAASETVYTAKEIAQKNLKRLKNEKKPNLTKSELLQRAEQDYAQWEKREHFEQFMSKRLPHLAKGEIKAIGQTYLLKKSIEAEKSLNKLIKK